MVGKWQRRKVRAASSSPCLLPSLPPCLPKDINHSHTHHDALPWSRHHFLHSSHSRYPPPPPLPTTEGPRNRDQAFIVIRPVLLHFLTMPRSRSRSRSPPRRRRRSRSRSHSPPTSSSSSRHRRHGSRERERDSSSRRRGREEEGDRDRARDRGRRDRASPSPSRRARGRGKETRWGERPAEGSGNVPSVGEGEEGRPDRTAQREESGRSARPEGKAKEGGRGGGGGGQREERRRERPVPFGEKPTEQEAR